MIPKRIYKPPLVPDLNSLAFHEHEQPENPEVVATDDQNIHLEFELKHQYELKDREEALFSPHQCSIKNGALLTSYVKTPSPGTEKRSGTNK